MLKLIQKILPVTFLVSGLIFTGCKDENSSSKDFPPSSTQYDVDKYGIPKFIKTDYIESYRIQQISRFRSSEGHDYSDGFETCRSMKHYLMPFGGSPGMPHDPTWGSIRIFAPVSGTVWRIDEEWAGTQVQIQSKDRPAFIFIIFHIKLNGPLKIGDVITEGQFLGTHTGDQTMSDIAVGVMTPKAWKLISWFDTMTDSLFQTYQNRGVATRSDLIISKAERDANPATCSAETFLSGGGLSNWVLLR